MQGDSNIKYLMSFKKEINGQIEHDITKAKRKRGHNNKNDVTNSSVDISLQNGTGHIIVIQHLIV